MSYTASEIIIYQTDPIPFPDVQHSINSIRKKWLDEHQYLDELTLYHYTSLKGLRGIITERAIRCTQFDYLNDPLELQYGKELIIQKLKYFSNKETDPIIREFLNKLTNESKTLGQSSIHTIFISSFCDNKNLLDQWRGYASRGCGYNLGISFQTETKARNEVNDPIKFYLRKILYDTDKQTKIIEQYLFEIIEAIRSSLVLLKKIPEFDGQLILSKIRLTVENLLVDIMISLKNPVYVKEKEWRLIRLVRWDELPTIINFRENNDELVPYVNTFLYDENNSAIKFPLKEVRFGPMLDKLKTKKVLELLFKYIGTSTHDIKLKNNILIENA